MCAVAILSGAAAAAAQEQGALSGVVVDSLGARVAGGAVTLSR